MGVAGGAGADPGQAGQVLFGGIDATTGEPALPPIPVDLVAAVAAGERIDPEELAALQRRARAAKTDVLGVGEGIDQEDLAAAGWGVIFAPDTDPEVIKALKPLLDLRSEEASATKRGRYREFRGVDAVLPGERYNQFLVRQHVAPAPLVDPDEMPFYLLLVGGPKQISFEFQYGLDSSFAVGRLDFATPAEFGRYAAAVVAAERAVPAPRRVVLTGPRNGDDPPTQLSADHLLTPLAARLEDAIEEQDIKAWGIAAEIGEGHASKARLAELLGGGDPPAILMTASHGMVFPAGDPRQLAAQGALLCQDWPGRVSWQGAIPSDFYLAGADLPDAGGPAGMIALLFACYGAGTPKFDDFNQSAAGPAPIAPDPFVADLPRRLLAHPHAPALAVVGHVERALSYSFAWPGVGEQLGTFSSMLTALMKGRRLGSAFDYFNQRNSILSSDIEALREAQRRHEPVDPEELAGLWTARNDARNYVVLGDPAVRLPVSAP